jgi:hypothetical protein
MSLVQKLQTGKGESVNTSSIELLIEKRFQEMSVLINKKTEEVKVLITINDEKVGRLIERLNSQERILTDITKGFLQSSNIEPPTKSGKAATIQGNAITREPEADGVNTPLSRKLSTVTFDINAFGKAYEYKVNEALPSIMEGVLQEYSAIKDMVDLQAAISVYCKAHSLDIRKIIPGIAKDKFYNAMKKAVSFGKAISPAKSTTTTDKSDIITLANTLSPYDITVDKVNKVIETYKPQLDKSDYQKDGYLISTTFDIIMSDGFDLDIREVKNQVLISKIKLYLSKILAS